MTPGTKIETKSGAKGDAPAVRTLRLVLVALGLALPVLSLVPLGSFWLWQNGYLIHWAIGACLSTLMAWMLQRWLLGERRDTSSSVSAAEAEVSAGDATWTPAENAAWSRVQEIARAIEPEALTSREALFAIGQQTVEGVAKTLHPERKDPLLQFTAPEALALVERVSGRLETFVRENVPLGDRLTLAQLAELYRWRGAIEMAEQAWSVWRVLRMMNPASALANEVRERVSKELMAWGKSHIARNLATFYVEEVGRAAIDLYGGRLRLAPERLERHVTGASARDLAASDAEAAGGEPLRLLVAGQVSAGKSSLVNALAEEVRAAVDALPATARFTPYRLMREGLPAALVIDSPGLTSDVVRDKGQIEQLLEEAERADLVLWVVAATRADREADRAALAALRRHFAARTNRVAPPVLVVLTHVDRLRPFQEWAPPYDLNDSASPKAASMRDAAEAVAADLGVQAGEVVPCALPAGHASYNVDAVWAGITARVPEAQRARLVRTLRDAEKAWDWQRVWTQAQGAGRVLVDTIRR
jgi:predicted GTPase